MAPLFINSPTSIWTCTRMVGPDLAEPVAFAIAELRRAGYGHADIEPIRELLKALFSDWQADMPATATGEDVSTPNDPTDICSHTDLFIKLYSERHESLVRLVDRLPLLVVMPVLLLQDAVDQYVAGALRACDLLKRSGHCIARNATGEIVFDEEKIQQSNSTDPARIAKKRESHILIELEASTIDNIVFTMEDQIIMEDLLCARAGAVPTRAG